MGMNKGKINPYGNKCVDCKVGYVPCRPGVTADLALAISRAEQRDEMSEMRIQERVVRDMW